MCKRKLIASVCFLKENKRWRHQFLQVGTLTEFEHKPKSLILFKKKKIQNGVMFSSTFM